MRGLENIFYRIFMDKKLFKEIDDIEQSHWWFCGRRKIIVGALNAFVDSKKNTALDIGFGTGLNANLLKEFANTVYGLDPSDEAIELSKKRSPEMQVFKGNFPEYNFGKTYDIIILFDVLEHIENDSNAVTALEKLLNIGGVALITVPAFPSLWTEHDVVAHHYRRYSARRLRDLILNNSALSVKKLSYFNSFLFFPIFIFRFIRKTFNLGKGSSDFFLFPDVFNKLFYLIFSFESYLLRYINLPIGVSLLCVVKKQDEK